MLLKLFYLFSFFIIRVLFLMGLIISMILQMGKIRRLNDLSVVVQLVNGKERIPNQVFRLKSLRVLYF